MPITIETIPGEWLLRMLFIGLVQRFDIYIRTVSPIQSFIVNNFQELVVWHTQVSFLMLMFCLQNYKKTLNEIYNFFTLHE